ncbi:hypothetical protein LPJ57_003148, partial [Coemansia sp. RSA 486]
MCTRTHSKSSKSITKGASKSHNSTPYKNRSQNLNTDVNKNRSFSGLLSERKKEAEYIAREDLEHNANVPQIARPRRPATAKVSRSAADYACERLEEYIASIDNQSGINKNKRGSKHDDEYPDSFQSLIDLVKPHPNGDDGDPEQRKLAFKREPEMYPSIAALLRLIDKELVKYSENSSKAPQHIKPNRQIQVFEKYDVNPEQMDTDRKIDMALYLSKDGEQITGAKPDYEYIFAVVEAKISSIDSEQFKAYKQLIAYSYDIYTRQINRRFAWGFTVCSTLFRACVLSNDKVYSSENMDVSTKEGRAALVQLLADITYCSDDQLGYDPTIYFDEDKSWKVQVFQDDNLETFRICKVMKSASSIFGRHTRCFRCCRIDDEKDNDDDKYFIVKDAWAFTDRTQDSEQGLRDEIELMKSVNKALENREQLRNKYPTLICGGVVQISDGNGECFDDTEDTALAALNIDGTDENHSGSYRVHKRMALRPIGQHISTVKSVDELIV